MRYYIIAGEASGDLHGSNLIKAIREIDGESHIRCWGGDKMSAAGGEVVKHIKDLAYMGFYEVLKHLPKILGNIAFCKKDILAYQPDVVVLIDYPGFNFRLLKFLKQHGFRVYYYISPQLWAWKKGRIKAVKKYVDKMLVIFPFEKAFYEENGVRVNYVGHPLLDELKNVSLEKKESSKKIALIPGSRKQEISYLLPEYLKVIEDFPEYEFIVTGMGTIGRSFYEELIKNTKVRLTMDDMYGVLCEVDCAIVTSGTATLETALFNVPEVICYKGSWISYLIAHLFIDKSIGFICIVNLICKKRVVEELIQSDVNRNRLKSEVKKLLDPAHKSAMLNDYNELKNILGSGGASLHAAREIYEDRTKKVK